MNASEKIISTKYDDATRQVRKLTRVYIPELLNKNALSSKEILLRVSSRFHEFCDDTIPCQCKQDMVRPEWEHQVLWAIQDCKYYGKIRYDKKTRCYYRI